MPAIVGLVLVRSCRSCLLYIPYMVCKDERGNRKRCVFVCLFVFQNRKKSFYFENSIFKSDWLQCAKTYHFVWVAR